MRHMTKKGNGAVSVISILSKCSHVQFYFILNSALVLEKLKVLGVSLRQCEFKRMT
jgi:hypothetical protein